MNKRYTINYRVFNEPETFAFDTDDLLGIDQLIEHYVRNWICADCFFMEIYFFIYDNGRLIRRSRIECKYSYF